MNQAYLHLLFNHLPIVGTLIGAMLLAGGMIFKSFHVKRASLLVLVFAGVTSLLANSTGEGAEKIVEELEGVSHKVIHYHEEIAEKYFLVTSGTGLLALVTFFLDWKNKPVKKILYPALLLLLALSIYLGLRTANSGGEIRHPEIKKSERIASL